MSVPVRLGRTATLVLGLVAGVAGAVAAPAAEGPPPRRVTLTIDDLPWAEIADTAPAARQARHRRLIAALRGTHAVGFVNEDKLEVAGVRDPSRVELLVDWLDAGLELGNHTYGHGSLHAVPIDDYEAAILRGETVLRPLLASRGAVPRWFRHPYLHAGRDDAVRARLDAFLAAHGYRVAPVTIDNGDWIYARAYRRLLDAGEDARAAALRDGFVDYLEAKFRFYEDASRRLLGREIPQVLLLHANALVADTLATLTERLTRRGYVFVPLADALRDPAFAAADPYRGPAGISWLHRWALGAGMPKPFFAGEPMVPDEVLALAGVASE